MVFNEILAVRVRDFINDKNDIVEKKMFGGIAFLLNGNMSIGIHKDKLIVRVGAAKYDEAVAIDGINVFDITGRPMKGWVMISEEVIEDDENLFYWCNLGLKFAESLPAK